MTAAGLRGGRLPQRSSAVLAAGTRGDRAETGPAAGPLSTGWRAGPVIGCAAVRRNGVAALAEPRSARYVGRHVARRVHVVAGGCGTGPKRTAFLARRAVANACATTLTRGGGLAGKDAR